MTSYRTRARIGAAVLQFLVSPEFEALKEMGKRIPEDVAVIGYDDREIAQFMRPALTTMLLPHFDMGVLAAEYLIDHAARPEKRPAQIKAECPLIERASVNGHTAEPDHH